MRTRIRRNIPGALRKPFYVNIALYHLPQPIIKINPEKEEYNGVVDGYPIIHFGTGKCQ